MKKKRTVSRSRQKKSTRKKLTVYFFGYFVAVGVTLVITVFVSLFSRHAALSESFPCANSLSCVSDLSVHIENNATGTFEGKKVVPPRINLADDNIKQQVLGASVAPGLKHIEVNLTNQTLTAYQGTTVILKTLISSGKWDPTPDGTFSIWLKLRATRMTGGSGDDFYDLPNVPYVMYFYNDQIPKSEGFGIHGAYWHDNFGHPMSHGCINMRTVDAEKLYNWVDPPTTGTQTLATAENPGTQLTITGSPRN